MGPEEPNGLSVTASCHEKVKYAAITMHAGVCVSDSRQIASRFLQFIINQSE